MMRRRFIGMHCLLALGLLALGPFSLDPWTLSSMCVGAEPSTWFELPMRLEAEGHPIDTAVGHAAPWMGDLDHDGVRDLLVGQFGEGKLHFYRNLGSNDQPRFATSEFVQAGDAEARVPSG